MKLSSVKAIEETHAAISDVVSIREQTAFQRLMTSQAFWVAVALLALVVFMTWSEPTFGTADNVTNVTRNFAPLAIGRAHRALSSFGNDYYPSSASSLHRRPK